MRREPCNNFCEYFPNFSRTLCRLSIYLSYSRTLCRPLISELGWKTIDELIDNETKTMVFKSLSYLAPQYLCNLFTKNSACSSRSLRNTETDLRLPKKRSANGQKCFSFRGAKLWNSLPAESKKASSLVGSKNQYRVEHFIT